MPGIQTSLMLKRALAGLSPESFNHPIWRYYSSESCNPSLTSIQSLVRCAEDLQIAGQVLDACQILLLCAVLHNRRKDQSAALQVAQQAWDIAENNNLSQASNWCAWGLCALNVNKGEYRVAVSLLRWLEIKLHQEGEWITSNHVELIRMALNGGPQSGSDFEIILELFSSWGEPAPAGEAISGESSLRDEPTGDRQPLAPAQHNGLLGFRKRLAQFLEFRVLFSWFHRAEPDRGRDRRAAKEFRDLPPADALPVRRGPAGVHPRYNHRQENGLLNPQQVYGFKDLSEPVLTVHLLGPFRAAINDRPINDFPHGRTRSIFKYIVYHRRQLIPREVLMDLFWPDVDPESARNSLNVTFYNIRKALRSVTDLPIVLFSDGAYGLNPEIATWLDVEEFDLNISIARQLEVEGQINKAKVRLEIASNLYQGDFLAEDPYEEWTTYTRERLRAQYLDTLCRLCRFYYHQQQYTACAALCHLILKYDSCDEEAHRRLIRCYGRQNQYHLAIRQYHACADVLQNELGVKPAPRTVKLYERARRREHTQPLKLNLN